MNLNKLKMITNRHDSEYSYNRIPSLEQQNIDERIQQKSSSIFCLQISPQAKKVGQALSALFASLTIVAFYANPFGSLLSGTITFVTVAALLTTAVALSFFPTKRAINPLARGFSSPENHDRSIRRPNYERHLTLIDEIQKQAPEGTYYIPNLYIDSLSEKVKNRILGEDSVDELSDYLLDNPERTIDEANIKNSLVCEKGAVFPKDRNDSLFDHLQQLAIDRSRGARIIIEGNEIPFSSSQPSKLFNELIEQFPKMEFPSFAHSILAALEKQYPELSKCELRAILAHLHHGGRYEAEFRARQHGCKIKGMSAINMRYNSHLNRMTFSAGFLLEKPIAEPSLVTAVERENPAQESYKKRLGRIFNIQEPTSAELKNIQGSIWAQSCLNFTSQIKELHYQILNNEELEEFNDAFVGDIESVDLGSRNSSVDRGSDPKSTESQLLNENPSFWSRLFTSKRTEEDSCLYTIEDPNFVRVTGSFSGSEDS